MTTSKAVLNEDLTIEDIENNINVLKSMMSSEDFDEDRRSAYAAEIEALEDVLEAKLAL